MTTVARRPGEGTASGVPGPEDATEAAGRAPVSWSRVIGGLAGVVLLCLVPASPGTSADPTAGPAAHEALTQALDAVVDKSKLARATLGLEVMDVDTGEVLWHRNGTRGLNPASVLKVVTAAAALDTLGPGYRFTTDFLRKGGLKAGVLEGDLYIRGSGDPTMVYERLWKAAIDLKTRGVERVRGNLVLDDSAFDQVRDIAGWELDENDTSDSAYNAAVSALSANFNAVAVVVRPGAAPGELAGVALETPTTYARLRSQAITGSARASLTVDVVRKPVPGGVELVVKGTIPANLAPKVIYRPVVDPVEYYGALFRELYGQVGGRIEGRTLRGKTPDDAELVLRAWSSPLPQMLADMNKMSLNFIAEHVLKAVGATAAGGPGTTAKGLVASRRVLEQAGIRWEEVVVTNGSGLSRDNRLSADQLCRFLSWASTRFTWSPEFLHSLAVGGVDGTLRSRMASVELKGQVRGKTGTVNGVATLAGVQRTPSGRRLAFAWLANDTRVSMSEAREVYEELCQVLATGLPVVAPGTPAAR